MSSDTRRTNIQLDEEEKREAKHRVAGPPLPDLSDYLDKVNQMLLDQIKKQEAKEIAVEIEKQRKKAKAQQREAALSD